MISSRAALVWAGLALVLAAACGSALPNPTSADATLAAKRWPETTTADLEHGRSLYVKKCAGCHALKTPDEVAPEQWADEVADMRSRKKVSVTDAEADAMVRYLWSVGTRLRERQVASKGTSR
jgi:mono/diheme cytochrome c family protein